MVLTAIHRLGFDSSWLFSPAPHHTCPPPTHSPRTHICRRKFGEEEVGFRYVASGPLVRSSYRAGEFYVAAMLRQDRADSAAAVKLQGVDLVAPEF